MTWFSIRPLNNKNKFNLAGYKPIRSQTSVFFVALISPLEVTIDRYFRMSIWCNELLTIFSGIPTSIGGLFLTADATPAFPPQPPELRGE
jgi:hypothetical protein